MRIAAPTVALSIWANEGASHTQHAKERWLGAGKDPRKSPAIQASNQAGTVTVSGKPSIDVPPGTLNSILKRAGLK